MSSKLLSDDFVPIDPFVADSVDRTVGESVGEIVGEYVGEAVGGCIFSNDAGASVLD